LDTGFDMAFCRSFMTLSKPALSDDFRVGRGSVDDGGLDLELVLLVRL
jgi:hypothetical protein